jgi:hypothetical protein
MSLQEEYILTMVVVFASHINIPVSRAAFQDSLPPNCRDERSRSMSWLLLWKAQTISRQETVTFSGIPWLLRSICCRKNRRYRAALSSIERRCFSTVATHSIVSTSRTCSWLVSCGRATRAKCSLRAAAIASSTTVGSSSMESSVYDECSSLETALCGVYSTLA